MTLNHHGNFKVCNFLNKSKKTTVPLGLLCPTFAYEQNTSSKTHPNDCNW